MSLNNSPNPLAQCHHQRRPLATHTTRASGRANTPAQMKMDWPHSRKAYIQHCEKSPHLEPPRQEKKRSTQNDPEEGTGSRHQKEWVQLGTD